MLETRLPRRQMDRIVLTHASGTGAFGLLYLAYHAAWVHSPEPPFFTPPWLVYAQLAWAVLSFGALFLYDRTGRFPLLPALYVIFTTATYVYVGVLGSRHGTVRDEMVSESWKVLASLAGAMMLIEAARLVRSELRRDR